jgi:hypothetical protein
MTTKAKKPMPKAAREKTPDRLAVEDAIKAATRRGESCTIESLATRLDMTPKRVRTAVRNLMTVNMLVSTHAAGCVGAQYQWAALASGKKEPTDGQRRWSSGQAVLHTPTNGPGHTPMRLPTTATTGKALPQKVCNASMPNQDPLAHALRANADIAPERMTAYRLPSRVGNQLFYPDGRVEVVA